MNHGRKAFLSFMIIGLAVLLICSPVSADEFNQRYSYDGQYSYCYDEIIGTGFNHNVYSGLDLYLQLLDDYGNYTGLYYISIDIESRTEGNKIDYHLRDSLGQIPTGNTFSDIPFKLVANNIEYANGVCDISLEKSLEGDVIEMRIPMWFDNFENTLMEQNSTTRFQIEFEGYTVRGGGSAMEGYTLTPSVPNVNHEFRPCVSNGWSPRYDFVRIGSVVYPSATTQVDAFFNRADNPVNEISFQTDNTIHVYGYNEAGFIYIDDIIYDYRDYTFVELPMNFNFTNSLGITYDFTIGEGITPTTGKVSIITQVKSLSDNSLIAGSKVYYRALDGSDLQNKTLPSGTGEFHLQKGLRYEFWAEASGYENQTSIPDQAAFYADSSNEIRLTPTYGDEPGEGMGVYNFYISEQTNAAGDTAPLTSPAAVTLNWQTKLTTSSGYVSFQVNKSAQVSYTIRKDGYVTVSRIYTPSWTGDTINEYIAIRPEGQVLPGDPTAAPTPDHRTDTQRAEAAFSIIFSNIEAFATLTCIVLLLSFIKWMKL